MFEKITFKIHLSNGKIYDISEEPNKFLKSIIENIFQKENIHYKINNVLLNGKELILNKTISENNIKKDDIININLDLKIMNIINNMKKLINNWEEVRKGLNDKLIFYLISFSEKILKIYMDKNNKKKFILLKRYFRYIKNCFVKFDLGKNEYKYLYNSNINNVVLIFSVVFTFNILLEMNERNNKIKNTLNDNQKLKSLNELLSIFIYNISYFYSIQLINEEKLESYIKCLITLSKSINNKVDKNNDNIQNSIFLINGVKLFKIIVYKLLKTNKDLNVQQKKFMSNIIIYIKNNIIESSNHKSLNIINKNFLSNNNFVTNCLFDMIFLISKTKDEQITKNYIELLTNIYAFSFRYDNLMVQLLNLIKYNKCFIIFYERIN